MTAEEFKKALKDFGIGLFFAIVTGAGFAYWEHSQGLPLSSGPSVLGLILSALGVLLLVYATERKLAAILQTLFGIVALLLSTVLFVTAASHPHPQPPEFAVVDHAGINWQHLIKRVDRVVSAEGIALDNLEVHDVVNVLKKPGRPEVNLVFLDPEGTAVCQRSKDENPVAPHNNVVRIRDKIRSFQVAEKTVLGDAERGRLHLLVRDTYPTMAVYVLDDDLYVYFYSLGKLGTESPVLKFADYNKSDLAHFFSDQLEASSSPNQGTRNGAHSPIDYTVEKTPQNKNCKF